MPRTQPKGMDVERFLFASGMIADNPTAAQKYLDLDLAAEAAYEDFQRDTRIKPFMAEGSDTTRYYPVNGPLVAIHPYFSITAVHIKSTPFETSSESKTHITDFIKLPDQETPTQYLEFNYHFYSASSSIGVTGKRGWTDDMPADVFQALLGQAAGVHLQPSIAGAIHSGAIKWQEGDVSEQYGSMGAFTASCERWAKHWEKVTSPQPTGYKRVQVAGA